MAKSLIDKVIDNIVDGIYDNFFGDEWVGKQNRRIIPFRKQKYLLQRILFKAVL